MFRHANEAIDWIQGARYKGQKNGLENTRALLNELGNPQEAFRCVHIAGTNGKGSTSAFTERVLREAGHVTGLYTSPYLIRYNERVQVCGRPIPDDILTDLTNRIAEKTARLLERGVFPTTFELGTALAFLYFAESGVDTAVVEVGLGGRFDATNVITPEVSLIAAIGLDHMKILGDTVEQIAFEKAGIVKPGVPAVAQAQAENILDVFRTACRERGCAFSVAPEPDILEETAFGTSFRLDGADYEIGLCGRHQTKNAALAVCGLRLLGVDGEFIRAGLKKAKWPCRLEWVDGMLIDGAHNPQGALALRDYLTRFFPGEKITLAVGMMHDKQTEECARILAPLCREVVATAVDEPRAAEPEYLAGLYENLGVPAAAVPGVNNAVNAVREKDGIRVFAGSLYLAGAVREALRGPDCFTE